MECGIPMNRWLLTLSFLLLCWRASMPANAATEEPYLVLVTSAQSTIPALSANEVQHLYLGVTLFSDGKAIKPLLNYSDSYTQETFMFKVMMMSTQAYERQMLAKIFRVGGNRPPVHAGLASLIHALKADPATISYMFSDQAGAQPDLKIINTLWKNED